MKKILLLLTLIAAYSISFSQTNKPVGTSSLSGQFLASYDGSTLYFNMGGPNITYTINKNTKLSLCMLPSLRIIEDPVKPMITPILGSGITMQYKKFVIGLPCYYIQSDNKWKLSFGIGYKF